MMNEIVKMNRLPQELSTVREIVEKKVPENVLSGIRSYLKTEIMPSRKLSREESLEKGKTLRKQVKRSSHAGWTVTEERTEPIKILEEQEKDRVQELLPIRHERMKESAFAYYRGTAAVMTEDLAKTPTTGILVQACGDAHIGNFGVFGTGEKRLVFDINDFDESYPGPWEWDVKRLATSVEICGRYRGFSEEDRVRAVKSALNGYHTAMDTFSQMGTMEMWYAHLDVEEMQNRLNSELSKDTNRMIDKVRAEAVTKNSFRAVHKWTENVDGQLRFRSIPPILVPLRDMTFESVEPEKFERFMKFSMEQYRMSLPREMRRMIDQYTPVDIARKVVGVGSVGMRSFITVMQGNSDNDPLVLQFKEAGPSVLAPYVQLGKDGEYIYTGKKMPLSGLQQNGRRVVQSQKMIQTAGDILLGWMRVPDMSGRARDFYVRQLWNNKGSIDLDAIKPDGLVWLAETCGWTLAHAHARTGDRHAIAGYLGKGSKFEDAVAEFAKAYADQNEADYQTYLNHTN